MKNSYFQLLHKADGTYLRLIPPESGGEKLQLGEVMEYLNSRSISYDVKELNDNMLALVEDGDTIEFKLISTEISPVRESYSLTITQDQMKAVARFYPPSEGAGEMTAEEVIMDMRAAAIKYGIRSENIMQYFQDRAYCTDIVLAEGKPVRIGRDAKVEYLFSTDRKAKPELLEDGSVDFHSLNTICHCRKGDLLARLIPEDAGESGITIYGAQVKPPSVKKKALKYGRNIELSEDKCEIRSKVNGHVTLVDEQVFVSDLLELEDVGVSTGNIEYEGGILITGNVSSGYSVKASGDIEIRGVVEGARVEAGGNISIARGMNGMAKGVLVAKGNIVSKFLENAEAYAEGFVSTEAILHSKVQAGLDVEVTGRKGFIVGGKVMASNKVKVKTLGSDLGAPTIIEVGVAPKLKKEQQELQKQVSEDRKYIANIEPVLTATLQKSRQGIQMSEDQMKYVQQLAVVRKQKLGEVDSMLARLKELDEVLVGSENPVVEVSGEVYPGVRIGILDVSMVVKSSVKYCRFIRSEGEVKIAAL